MTKTWGAIFDFDGVIVDTAAHHEHCWQQVAQERSATMTHEQFIMGFGVKNDLFIADILGWTQGAQEIKLITERKEALFQALVLSGKVDFVEGVIPFIQLLHAHNIPCSIASSSILKNIEIILENTSICQCFSTIISGENVKVGKPNPDCFLQAAKSLGLPPEKCVVFEDAIYGVEAAKRAGCKCVAITTTFNKNDFEKYDFKPDVVVDQFKDVNFADIDNWFE